MTTLDDAREGMDPAIRPQDDLFGHMNGRWLAEVPIPADRSSWGPFIELSDVVESQVQAIITELSGREPAERTDDEARIAALYASFMDVDAVEARGIDPLRATLAQVDALSAPVELAAFLGRFERFGGSGLFGCYVDTDDRDSDRYLVNLLQGGLGLPDESYYREDKHTQVREKYLAYLQRVFELIGAADPPGDAAGVLALESALAAGHWERAETRDVQKTYNLTTREQLEALAPRFDWSAYLDGLGAAADLLAESCVRQPSYLAHLSGVLGDRGVEAWKPYLRSRVVHAGAPYLSSAVVDNDFDFHGRTLSGTPQLRPRWKRGVAVVQGAVGEAVGREYVARHFPPHAKEMMDALVANLLEAYRRSIEALDWMGEATKARAYEKIASFRPKIGYPAVFR
ncbi:MAG: M13 family metallopeptidase, partial [Frankiaceae bacterium]|nr:M13 family metallopeptidase [Frankiaceae bacterium]